MGQPMAYGQRKEQQQTARKRNRHHITQVTPEFMPGNNTDHYALYNNLSGAYQVFAPGATQGNDANN